MDHRTLFATGSGDYDAITRNMNNTSLVVDGKSEEKKAIEYWNDIPVRKNCPAPRLEHMHPSIIDTARACRLVQIEKNADEHTKRLQLCREVKELLGQCRVLDLIQLPLYAVAPPIEIYLRAWGRRNVLR